VVLWPSVELTEKHYADTYKTGSQIAVPKFEAASKFFTFD
jgi:hypothetical protein